MRQSYQTHGPQSRPLGRVEDNPRVLAKAVAERAAQRCTLRSDAATLIVHGESLYLLGADTSYLVTTPAGAIIGTYTATACADDIEDDIREWRDGE